MFLLHVLDTDTSHISILTLYTVHIPVPLINLYPIIQGRTRLAGDGTSQDQCVCEPHLVESVGGDPSSPCAAAVQLKVEGAAVQVCWW